ncbi:hypothetical protein [Gilvibacter sp.]|uniref:hypothetical protein n=1 Tax=Gilvibacter sp. TaxID=2729997 RepID=UPI0035BE88B6
MKKRLTILLLLGLVGITNAQTNSAKADFSQIKALIPYSSAELEAQQKQFQDSLMQALERQYDIKKLEEEANIFKNQQEYNAGDEATQLKFTEAQEKLQKISDYYNQAVSQNASKLYKPFLDLSQKIRQIIAKNGYDLIFLFGPNGVESVEYKDVETYSNFQNSIVDCARKKGFSNQADYNEKLNMCSREILSPLMQNSVDITELVIQELKK